MNINEQRMSAAPFSEKAFYLAEFRGRTLAIAAPKEVLHEATALESVLKELELNDTRVVLISNAGDALRAQTGAEALRGDEPRLEGRVWRGLSASPCVGVETDAAGGFEATTRDVALRLRVSKLLWIDAGGALLRDDGRRHSFVDIDELRALLEREPADSRTPLLRETLAMLSAGLPAVNLCTLEGLADELFSYEGSGTLFTVRRYVEVRQLGIDDFDAAWDLVARGVAEGFLAPRTEFEIERVLACGIGAFVEGRHLAGIGALLPWEVGGPPVAEIASLYTLTRFVGEGVGGHLVRFAVDRARDQGCAFVFACTTSDRVVAFFERHGFRQVDPSRVPVEKWRDYDPARRSQARCLATDL
ncbi:MAG: GNAT family N-acetyltransferase [Myxococcales bacterium]|nr:GNAT family N-acetyltransferase [Myxococcales bacterium]